MPVFFEDGEEILPVDLVEDGKGFALGRETIGLLLQEIDPSQDIFMSLVSVKSNVLELFP